MKDDIVIVSAARTAVGAFNGGLSGLPAHELGKVAIQGSAGDALTVSIFEFIKQAGGDPLVLNDPGSVQAFDFLQKLEPLMTPEYQTAKFDTMNTILSNDTAYLGSNWPFGISVIVQKRNMIVAPLANAQHILVK